jgi:hypothetical protein
VIEFQGELKKTVLSKIPCAHWKKWHARRKCWFCLSIDLW